MNISDLLQLHVLKWFPGSRSFLQTCWVYSDFGSWNRALGEKKSMGMHEELQLTANFFLGDLCL